VVPQNGRVPFVELRWDQQRLPKSIIIAVRDAVRPLLAEALTKADPDHVVTPVMVDVALRPYGEDDIIAPPAYVTMLARHESGRHRQRHHVVTAIFEGLVAAGAPPEVMVELVLTQRSSNYRYAQSGSVHDKAE
jgi:hypothetical protein